MVFYLFVSLPSQLNCITITLFIKQTKMGKAQSKRSVDITTEPSKEIQEGSGELKKLDDAYFKENESSVSVATAEAN